MRIELLLKFNLSKCIINYLNKCNINYLFLKNLIHSNYLSEMKYNNALYNYFLYLSNLRCYNII